jgi:hypothetical protein
MRNSSVFDFIVSKRSVIVVIRSLALFALVEDNERFSRGSCIVVFIEFFEFENPVDRSLFFLALRSLKDCEKGCE